MILKNVHFEARQQQLYDAIVVGGGAGGLSAAVYLARYNLKVLVIEKGLRASSAATNSSKGADRWPSIMGPTG